MKKLFVTPELELIKFAVEDIITSSSLFPEEDFDGAIEMPKI